MYMVDTKGRFRGYPEKARGEGVPGTASSSLRSFSGRRNWRQALFLNHPCTGAFRDKGSGYDRRREAHGTGALQTEPG